MITYGAPLWADILEKNKRTKGLFKKLQRKIALKIISAYRTVSHEAADILARLMPVKIMARRNKEVYERGKAIKERIGGQPVKKVIEAIRREEDRRAIERWKERLVEDYLPGKRVRKAIIPRFEEWIERGHGEMNFYLTQMMTGHGVFGEYRDKIGKSETAKCFHCPSPRDTAQHTMEICAAWDAERREMRRVIKGPLTLGNVVNEILEAEKKWEAFSNFCTKVLGKKEEEERRRERE